MREIEMSSKQKREQEVVAANTAANTLRRLFVGRSRPDVQALNTAARRGRIRRIVRGVYTDDLHTPLEQIVEEDLLAILGSMFEGHYASHSTAALLRSLEGNAYISGPGSRSAVQLPGVTLNRLKPLPHPDLQTLQLDRQVATSLSADPVSARVKISSPLQAVFEVLSTDARQPARTLPETNVRGLLEALSTTDRLRAEQFAERNGLKSEWTRFRELTRNLDAARGVGGSRTGTLDVFFYHWRIGALEELSGREYRFTYDRDWSGPLTAHLPFGLERAPYEGLGLPPFFDNLLPEGWAEARLQAVHHLPRDDLFGLLRTTQKYLSNLTLRPVGFDASRLVLDHLDTRLDDLSPDPTEKLDAREEIGLAPDTRAMWLELQRRGATRLSGVQAKLPVHLKETDGVLRVTLAGVESTNTHILKFESREASGLVENEWATMELARRVGLSVASVRRIAFQDGSAFPAPSLLVERFDIPLSLSTPETLYLIEDAASLLSLPREDKYRPSLERVCDALKLVGLDDDAFFDFLDHAVFSWIVGNGDLHAKNISILRGFSPGAFGASPTPGKVVYSPLYDLLSTNLVIRDDLFALPVNGRANNLRARDFLVLVERWGLPKRLGSARIERVAAETERHVGDVLDDCGLPDEECERYAEIVRRRIEKL